MHTYCLLDSRLSLFIPFRLWPAAFASHLLQRVAPSTRQGRCNFEASLLGHALAFIFDHHVHGRPMLPGSALFEATLAVGHMLSSPTSAPPPAAAAPIVTPVAATQCSISVPMLLSGSQAAMRLRVVAGIRDGSMEILSSDSKATHLTAVIKRCQSLQTQPAHQLQAFATRTHHVLLAGLDRTAAKAAFQLADVAVLPALHMDGFCSHPAIVDSSFHLGASLGSSKAGKAGKAAGDVRVPVTVAAVAAGHAFEPHHALLHAQGHLNSHTSASSVSSYRVINGGAHSAVEVASMEARPFKLPAVTHPAAPLFAAAGSEARSPLQVAEPATLYELQWEAYSRAQYAANAGAHALTARDTGLMLSAANSPLSAFNLCTGDHSTAAAYGPATSLLASLKGMLGGGAGRKVQVTTHGALQALAAAQPGATSPHQGASMWGLLRVAAAENPTLACSLVDLDAAAVGSHRAASEAVDVTGSIVRAGLLLRPMLTPAVAPNTLSPASGFSAAAAAASGQREMMKGRVVVTGGLGGKGRE